MRAVWRDNAVISLKLRDDLYGLAQMLASPYMRFYAIFKDNDDWQGVNLNTVEPLFCVAVGNVVIQRLGVRRVPETEVAPSHADFERYFIDAGDNAEGYRLRDEFLWRGGALVDLGSGKDGSYDAPIVIPNLTIDEHKDIILKHEFTNMYGDSHVKNRLLNFHENGINMDPMKKDVFPGLFEN